MVQQTLIAYGIARAIGAMSETSAMKKHLSDYQQIIEPGSQIEDPDFCLLRIYDDAVHGYWAICFDDEYRNDTILIKILNTMPPWIIIDTLTNAIIAFIEMKEKEGPK